MNSKMETITIPKSEGPLDTPHGSFCCSFLKHQLTGTCRGADKHVCKTEQCPDQFICYNGKFREYSINPIGWGAYTIHFCPSCGHKFPESLRHEWFEKLLTIGIDPWKDEIPKSYKSDTWWR